MKDKSCGQCGRDFTNIPAAQALEDHEAYRRFRATPLGKLLELPEEVLVKRPRGGKKHRRKATRRK